MHPTLRAGPVAGLPIESLLGRAEDISRRWAISLVLARPLGGIGAVPLEELASEAPALCSQMLRALESDEELDRLTGADPLDPRAQAAPARRLAAIAGAADGAAVVESTESLRGALWETLLEELGWPSFEHLSARRVADVSDRLAFVCSSAALATLGVLGPQAQTPAGTPSAAPDARADSGPRQREPSAVRRAVIVDEREDPSDAAGAPAPAQAASEIEIRDARGHGPSAWVGSIGRQLERFARDGRSFAVLLVEVQEPERGGGDGPGVEAAARANQLEHVLASELRSSAGQARADSRIPAAGSEPGSLTRERPGRYWLLLPDTDGSGARALADRLLEAVTSLARRTGVRLDAAVGTAVCPRDGREPAALAAHADVELYAARSAAAAAAAQPPTSDF